MKINKYSFLLWILCFSLPINSQIGVNTETPQTIFHIDALANNKGTIPSVAQQLDDVYMGITSDNEAVLSLGKLPEINAQLSLNDANKSFLPNKVALTSLLDIVTVPSPQTGMMVYNTANVSGTNGVLPGLYVYEDNKWKYLFTEDTKKLQMRGLETAVVTPACASADYNCATPLDFGSDIIIPDTGAYGVGINLYGKPNSTLTTPSREVVYIWLMANNVPVDVAELNFTGFTGGSQFTYTVILGGKFNVGDKLSCRLSYYSPYHPIYLYPSKTFMLYWKLEQSSM